MKQFRLLTLSVAMTGLIGLLTAASGVAATEASASGSPITLAYVSSLTGAGASQDAGRSRASSRGSTSRTPWEE